jgi:hypothetical protein
MTDDDRQPVEGEIVGPEGDGQWQSATTAHVALRIGSKTLYRRIERGQIPSRKNAMGRIEVWVPAASPPEQQIAPTVGVSVNDTREIVASLVAALTDSQLQSDERLERAIRAELRVAELERLSLTRPERQDDNPWWRAWLRWWRLRSGAGGDEASGPGSVD